MEEPETEITGLDLGCLECSKFKCKKIPKLINPEDSDEESEGEDSNLDYDEETEPLSRPGPCYDCGAFVAWGYRCRFRRGSPEQCRAFPMHRECRRAHELNIHGEWRPPMSKDIIEEDVCEEVGTKGWKIIKKNRNKRLITQNKTLTENKILDLMPLGDDKQWEKIRATADSGAGEHVCPPDMCPQFPTTESEGSKKGKEYRVANGAFIPNLGEKQIRAQDSNGTTLNIKPQVAKVNKFLASLGKICKAGNRVVLDEKDSFIQNKKTGTKTELRLENNVFVFDFWVEKEGPTKSKTPFQRQGK